MEVLAISCGLTIALAGFHILQRSRLRRANAEAKKKATEDSRVVKKME
jgi:hypothetical protein